MTSEAMERAAVVKEALSWLRTPHLHEARVKGAGVDCGTLLLEVFERVGLIPHTEISHLPHDWHMHQSEEIYLGHVETWAHPVETPGPGDIALYRIGRCISHGAIVVQWPQIIHAHVGKGVILDDALANLDLSKRLAGFWSVWGER